MKTIRILALLGTALVPALALADISGTWTATFDTQIGEQSYTYVFEAKGMQLNATAETANGPATITDGKIDGDTVSFVEHLTYQGMELTISYMGKIVSDDEIQFTRMVGEFGKEELVAKRSH
jgi:hypothetical protein